MVSRIVVPIPFGAAALLIAAWSSPASAQASAPGDAPKPDLEARVKALEEGNAAAKKNKNSLDVYWKDGIRLESADKAFELKIGGRMQFDAFFGDIDEDGESTLGGPLEDGTQMRRARLSLQGKVMKYYEFKFEHDFADKDGKAKVADMYAGIIDVENFPNLRAGHFKEPFGLEALQSANDTVFMERGLPFTFVPFRNSGIQFAESVLSDRMTWAVGGFRETNDNAYEQSDGSYAVTGRLTGLLWRTEKLDHLVHVGASASVRSPPADSVRYRSKPEANLALEFVDTGNMANVDGVTLLGAELLVLLDRFSVQGEWTQSQVARGAGLDDATFAGWYGLATWTITGEPRRYRATDGVVQMPRPAKSLFEDGGLGAWEVAARLSQVDLDDDAVAGGQLRDITLGLNWYPSPVMRVMINAIKAKLDRDPDDGSADILEARLQFAF